MQNELQLTLGHFTLDGRDNLDKYISYENDYVFVMFYTTSRCDKWILGKPRFSYQHWKGN